jgi:1-deoxy-D-xylulose-5-phosphate reductoisomerase
MVFPIMRALTGCRPDRSAGKKLEFDLLDLNFRKLDTMQFPFVADAFECIRLGGAYSIAYNAADEAAVRFFMDGRIKYTDIHSVVRRVLDCDWSRGPAELSEIPLLEKTVWERAAGAL